MGQATAPSGAPPKKKRLLWILVLGGIAVIGMFANNRGAPTTQTTVLSLDEMQSRAARIPQQITYETLAREPAANKGRIVSFRGRVAQAVESGDRVTLRIAVTEGRYAWDDYLYVDYTKADPNEARILEKDIVEVLGEYVGIKTYTGVLRNEIQVPHVVARTIQRV